jgi:hypothetical protein
MQHPGGRSNLCHHLPLISATCLFLTVETEDPISALRLVMLGAVCRACPKMSLVMPWFTCVGVHDV